jgi:hypothetical protein
MVRPKWSYHHAADDCRWVAQSFAVAQRVGQDKTPFAQGTMRQRGWRRCVANFCAIDYRFQRNGLHRQRASLVPRPSARKSGLAA